VENKDENEKKSEIGRKQSTCFVQHDRYNNLFHKISKKQLHSFAEISFKFLSMLKD